MKAVARLVCSYFTGTPVLRAFTIGGLALMRHRLLHPDDVSRNRATSSGSRCWA